MSKQSCKSCAFWGNARAFWGNARPAGIKLPATAANLKKTDRWKMCDVEPKMFANADFGRDHLKLRGK
jgi:hypothetical protein